MSTPTPTPPLTVPATSAHRELKLISHSSLFYWWPVWVFGFFFAIWTSIEDTRMMTVPKDTTIVQGAPDTSDAKIEYKTFVVKTAADKMPKLSERAVEHVKNNRPGEAFPVHMSQHAWLGSFFAAILLLVVFITNVPLRGLWSFLVIILLIVVALFLQVFHGWDELLERASALRVYINLAGYLTIATVVFILWLLATFVFDRRAYVIFTPGQIKVCEHIGDSVKTFDTVGVTFEKQRDDLFRHYILGFGSGDLILKTAGADRHVIKMPNVLGIGWQLQAVENMLRERAMTNA